MENIFNDSLFKLNKFLEGTENISTNGSEIHINHSSFKTIQFHYFQRKGAIHIVKVCVSDSYDEHNLYHLDKLSPKELYGNVFTKYFPHEFDEMVTNLNKYADWVVSNLPFIVLYNTLTFSGIDFRVDKSYNIPYITLGNVNFIHENVDIFNDKATYQYDVYNINDIEDYLWRVSVERLEMDSRLHDLLCEGISDINLFSLEREILPFTYHSKKTCIEHNDMLIQLDVDNEVYSLNLVKEGKFLEFESFEDLYSYLKKLKKFELI